MKRFIAAFLLALTITTTVIAQQINIDAKNHVPNVGNGYCGHCCIETIGRHFGIKEVEGRVTTLHQKWGDIGGFMRDDEVIAALDEYKFKHFVMPRGTYNYYWLRAMIDMGYPCIVNLKAPAGTNISHYVTLVGVYSDKIGVIDSNRAGRVVWYTRDDFNSRWTGGFIMVLPK